MGVGVGVGVGEGEGAELEARGASGLEPASLGKAGGGGMRDAVAVERTTLGAVFTLLWPGAERAATALKNAASAAVVMAAILVVRLSRRSPAVRILARARSSRSVMAFSAAVLDEPPMRPL